MHATWRFELSEVYFTCEYLPEQNALLSSMSNDRRKTVPYCFLGEWSFLLQITFQRGDSVHVKGLLSVFENYCGDETEQAIDEDENSG